MIYSRPLVFIAIVVAFIFTIGCTAVRSAGGPGAVSITEFGAVADSTTLNTAAIQKTIDAVATKGGGTVIIPKGVFLSGSVFLKPGVNLHLEKNAVLKGTTDIEQYPTMLTRIEGHFEPWRPALINADQADHLRIAGQGTLDGSGQPFWKEFRSRMAANRSTKNLDVHRPRLVFIQNSNDVEVRGLHFKDSGFWNLHIYRCTNVTVEGLDISAPPGSPSTDGMDIDSSQHVTIRHCRIGVNDDCIALKGSKGPLAMEDKDSPPVEHIRISDCTFTQGPAVITCGSEATIVRDVIVERCRVEGANTKGTALLRLKLRPDTPQAYSDIHLRDITLNGAGSLILIAPWRQYFDLKGHAPPSRSVRNVSIENVRGTFGSFGTMKGNDGDVLEQITLKNINVKLTNPTPQIGAVKDLVVDGVKVNGQAVKAPSQAD